MKDLGEMIELKNFDSIINKGLTGDKISESDGISVEFDLAQMQRITPYWELIFAVENIKKR